MMTSTIRLEADTPRELLAFVTIPGETETRVRWSPGNWRCDACGPRPWPLCAHASAVVNSPTYNVVTEKSAASYL